MLRVAEIRLPIGHAPDLLKRAILKKLDIPAGDLTAFAVFKRGHDARKKNAIVHVYTLDVEVADEVAILARNLPHVRLAPDTEYKFVARAPEQIRPRRW